MKIKPRAVMRHIDNTRVPPRKPRRVKLDFAGCTTALYAGPYMSYREHRSHPLLVKMAAEIEAPCDISVPTADFGVPDEKLLRKALWEAAISLLDGRPVFVGCHYGIGRTGLFLAALIKLHQETLSRIGRWKSFDPVEEVRRVYYAGAVETAAQAEFVRGLSTRWASMALAFKVAPRAVFNKRFWVQSP